MKLPLFHLLLTRSLLKATRFFLLAIILLLVIQVEAMAEPGISMLGSMYFPAGRMASDYHPGPSLMIDCSLDLNLYHMAVHLGTGYIDIKGKDEKIVGSGIVPLTGRITAGFPVHSIVIEPGFMAGVNIITARYYSDEIDLLLKRISTGTSTDPVIGCSLYISWPVSPPVSVIGGVEYQAMIESTTTWMGIAISLGARYRFNETGENR